MTTMTNPLKGTGENPDRIVYVRPVPLDELTDLPEDVREQLGTLEVLYSVNAPDGQRLALVADRGLAFHLARSHDYAPHSVH